MIVEYTQLMSTAHRVLDGKQETIILPSGRKKKAWILSDEREQILYKSTHINHPSAVYFARPIEKGEYVSSHNSALLVTCYSPDGKLWVKMDIETASQHRTPQNELEEQSRFKLISVVDAAGGVYKSLSEMLYAY